MRGSNKLSATAVVTKKFKPGCYADGHGLYLQVAEGGSKSWLFRFMRNGRARKMGLGPIHTVSLAEARDEALLCRQRLRKGIDPIEARRASVMQARVEEAKAISFRQCAESYIESHRAGWKNDKHAAQWPSTLESYVYPVFGDLPVAAIDTALVLKAIEPIWRTKPETASRVRGRIEKVLDWARAREYRSGDNPAAWRCHLDNLLPARSKVAKVEHHAALPYAETPAFMGELRELHGVSPRALEFAILTAARTGEVLGARWSEIDPKHRMWTIPAERMKAGREHRVPLSDRAIEVLDSLPREGEFVFIGGKAGRPLSKMALLMTLRRMKHGDLTAHGFRSTFRDWAAEQTAYPNEMAEMALAHVVSDKTEAAYRRGDMLEKRRRLMGDWAVFCAPAPKTDAAQVVPIRSRLHA